MPVHPAVSLRRHALSTATTLPVGPPCRALAPAAGRPARRHSLPYRGRRRDGRTLTWLMGNLQSELMFEMI